MTAIPRSIAIAPSASTTRPPTSAIENGARSSAERPGVEAGQLQEVADERRRPTSTIPRPRSRNSRSTAGSSTLPSRIRSR